MDSNDTENDVEEGHLNPQLDRTEHLRQLMSSDEKLSEDAIEEADLDVDFKEEEEEEAEAHRKHGLWRHIKYNYPLLACYFVLPHEPLQRPQRICLYALFLLGSLMVTLLGSTPFHLPTGETSTENESTNTTATDDNNETNNPPYYLSDPAVFALTVLVSLPGMFLFTGLLNWAYNPRTETCGKYRRTLVVGGLWLYFIALLVVITYRLFTLPLRAIERSFMIWGTAWCVEQLIDLGFHIGSYYLCIRCCCPCCKCCGHCYYWTVEHFCCWFFYTMNTEAVVSFDHNLERLHYEQERQDQHEVELHELS